MTERSEPLADLKHTERKTQALLQTIPDVMPGEYPGLLSQRCLLPIIFLSSNVQSLNIRGDNYPDTGGQGTSYRVEARPQIHLHDLRTNWH